MVDDDITRLTALAADMVRAMPRNTMALELSDLAARIARNRAPKPVSKPRKPRANRKDYMREYMTRYRAKQWFK